MLDDVTGFLRCPQCDHDGVLTRAGGTLRCEAGHSFDIARAGYVSLLAGGRPKNSGDTAAMVRARHAFLTTGHFSQLAASVAAAAQAALGAGGAGGADGDCGQEGCVVDVGAGTGYYLAAVLDRLPSRAGIALDLSKSALRLAAKAHPRVTAVGCDAWRPLPVASAAADLALSMFAPRDGAELRRILSPRGMLLVVSPAPDHLAELTVPLGLLAVDERKQERLTAKLEPHFARVSSAGHRATLSLDHDAVGAVASMGPSSWHIEPGELATRIGRLPEEVTVTVAVRLASYQPA